MYLLFAINVTARPRRSRHIILKREQQGGAVFYNAIHLSYVDAKYAEVSYGKAIKYTACAV